MVWSGGLTAIIWLIGKKLDLIRVPKSEEIIGMDLVKHTDVMRFGELEYLSEYLSEKINVIIDLATSAKGSHSGDEKKVK